MVIEYFLLESKNKLEKKNKREKIGNINLSPSTSYN